MTRRRILDDHDDPLLIAHLPHRLRVDHHRVHLIEVEANRTEEERLTKEVRVIKPAAPCRIRSGERNGRDAYRLRLR